MLRAGTTGEDIRQCRVSCTVAAERISMDCTGRRLWTEQVRRADLHGRGAKRHHRGNSCRISDPTSGDHRNAHRLDDLRHQRERPELRRQVVRQEMTAMAAGFEALRDDRVHATRLEPSRFINGRRRRQHLRTPPTHALEQLGLRQSEMKTDDRGLELAQRINEVIRKRSSARTCRARD